MEILVFIASACGAPFVLAASLPGTVAWLLLRRGRPLLPGPAEHLCRRCRYDLRGLGASGRCPECGEPRRIVVEDPTPR